MAISKHINDHGPHWAPFCINLQKLNTLLNYTLDITGDYPAMMLVNTEQYEMVQEEVKWMTGVEPDNSNRLTLLGVPILRRGNV